VKFKLLSGTPTYLNKDLKSDFIIEFINN
jgi:hypothetical protein